MVEATALPPLFLFHGDWSRYVEEVYDIYSVTIFKGNLLLENKPVRCRHHPPSKGKGYGFWHVVQEGKVEDDRIPDLRRCERIRWISWMIQQVGKNPEITWWEESRGTEEDRLLWLEAEDYLIILSKRNDYWLLKTAYMTNRHHKRTTLRKNRDAYWVAKKC